MEKDTSEGPGRLGSISDDGGLPVYTGIVFFENKHGIRKEFSDKTFGVLGFAPENKKLVGEKRKYYTYHPVYRIGKNFVPAKLCRKQPEQEHAKEERHPSPE